MNAQDICDTSPGSIAIAKSSAARCFESKISEFDRDRQVVGRALP
jgi:hypothetical protein